MMVLTGYQLETLRDSEEFVLFRADSPAMQLSMGELAHRHTQRLPCRFEKGRYRSVAAMKQMNCATHRRGSDHLLPLDPDEYRWPPKRFQTQVAKIRLERQNSKVGDHHFTRASPGTI